MRNREYPELPLVGVGGVVIAGGRVLLARRGSEPLREEWSIPGGLLEIGETLAEGVARELLEETGLTVRVLELVEVVDRIRFDASEGEKRDLLTAKAPLDLLTAEARPANATGTPTSRLTGDFGSGSGFRSKPRYHYVILDYLCEMLSGEPRAGGDVTDVTFAREDELAAYCLASPTIEVIRKAFAMTRARSQN